MTLLGRPLEILVAVLAFGFPGATVWFWHRLRGPRTGRVAQRTGLLVGSQLAAVLAAAVALNHIGYFYGSWSDLFRGQLTGAHITAVSTRHTRAGRIDVSPASAGHLSVRTTPTSPFSPLQLSRHGRLESLVIQGAASALAVHADVYFPPQYYQPAYRHTKFAGIEVLAGPPGTPTTSAYLDGVRRLMETHRSRPAVLVLLHPSLTVPPEALCADRPVGPLRETLYSADVPSQIAHAYRVEPTGWGVVGQGAGGYCAVKLAMVHPRVFFAAAAVDGYFSPPAHSGRADPWGGSKALRDVNDLNWRLDHMPAPPVSLLLISTQAPASKADAALAKRAGPPMTVRRLDLVTRGTTAELGRSASWLLARLPPAPVRP